MYIFAASNKKGLYRHKRKSLGETKNMVAEGESLKLISYGTLYFLALFMYSFLPLTKLLSTCQSLGMQKLFSTSAIAT